MSLRAIHAIFECDGCGCEFGADIDTASTRPIKWSMFDIAEDAIRAGSGWVLHRHDRIPGLLSIQRGKHLCPACTKAEDEKHTEDCRDDQCDGECNLRPAKVEAEARQADGGCGVSDKTREKLGLRQPGESVAAYMLRKGIPSVQPLPKQARP